LPALVELRAGAHHVHQPIEPAQIIAIFDERRRGGLARLPAHRDAVLDKAGEVETDRHGDDVDPLANCPLERPEQHLCRAAAAVIERFADQRLTDAARHADPCGTDIAAENGAGAMGAVAVGVPALGRRGKRLVVRPAGGEVATNEAHAPKCRVAGIDAGIEHRDAHAGAGEGRGVCADAPIASVGGGPLLLTLHGNWREQDGRHHLTDALHVWLAGGLLGLTGSERDRLDRGGGKQVRCEPLQRARAAPVVWWFRSRRTMYFFIGVTSHGICRTAYGGQSKSSMGA
jgi:hypothetical protein